MLLGPKWWPQRVENHTLRILGIGSFQMFAKLICRAKRTICWRVVVNPPKNHQRAGRGLKVPGSGWLFLFTRYVSGY